MVDLKELYARFTSDYYVQQGIYLAELPRKDLLDMIERQERLMDLVRYMRDELYNAKLVSLEEWTQLCVDNDEGKCVARLEGYDAVRKDRDTLKAKCDTQFDQLADMATREALLEGENVVLKEALRFHADAMDIGEGTKAPYIEALIREAAARAARGYRFSLKNAAKLFRL